MAILIEFWCCSENVYSLMIVSYQSFNDFKLVLFFYFLLFISLMMQSLLSIVISSSKILEKSVLLMSIDLMPTAH